MHNYYQRIFLVSVIGLISVTGCLSKKAINVTGSNKQVETVDSKKYQTEIERIKYYRNIIESTLPFKQVIWDATTSGEKIRNLTLWQDSLYVETKKLKLRAYTTDIGHPQWVIGLENLIDFPLCAIKDLPQKEIRAKERLKNLRQQLEDAENENQRDEAKIKNLHEQIRGTEQLLRGMITNDLLYYICDGILYCADRRLGKELWRKKLDFIPNGSPVATLTTVYIKALEFNRLYLFDLASRFERDWIKVKNPIMTQPVYEDPAIYFACDDGVVYAFNAETGKDIWEYHAERSIKADLLIEGDIIYVGSNDFALYAIDRHAGALRWKYETGFPITLPAAIGMRRFLREKEVIVEKTLFFKTDREENFYALLLKPLTVFPPYELRWKFPGGKKFLTYGFASVYVLGNDNQTLYALDIEKGTILNKYSLQNFPFRAVDADQQILYLGTSDGYIFAVREPPPQW